MRILLVEDDVMLAEALRTGLVQQGFDTDWAPDGAAAQLALIDHAYGMVLLDLGLPGPSGLRLLQHMRGRYDDTPVLIITARDQLSERVRGLDSGADDYMVKPFQPDELYARMRALLRRHQGRVTEVLRAGDVSLDPTRREVLLRGTPVPLRPSEFRTLQALMERPERVVAREQLEALVYRDSEHIESNTIAVYIHQLRRKLGNDVVLTVHGVGYRIGEVHGS